MKKKCQIVMLSTESPSNIYINRVSQNLELEKDYKIRVAPAQFLYIVSDEEIKESDYYIKDDSIFKCLEIINDARHGKVIVHHKDIEKCTNSFHFPSTCKKIIATTNPELTLIHKSHYKQFGQHVEETKVEQMPQIPKAFIEAYIKKYNEGNTIKEVMVEFNEWFTNDYDGKIITKIKLDSDNNILINEYKLED